MYKKIMNCADCNEQIIARSPNTERCRSCAAERRRQKMRERDRLIARKSRKRVGFRICRKCNESKPHAAYSVLSSGAITCDACRNCPPEKKAIVFKKSPNPPEWKTEFQMAVIGLAREIQQIAPSRCFSCIKMRMCRERVAEPDFVLPCQVSM